MLGFNNQRFNRHFLLIFLILYSSFLLSGFCLGIYNVTLSNIQSELNINDKQSGYLASAALLGMMIGALFLGILSDHIGRKKTLVSAIVLFSIFNGLIGFVSSYYTFMTTRFIAGVGIGALTPLCVSLLSEYSPKANRTFLITLVMTGMPLGQLIASLTGIVFLETQGWRFLYLLSYISLAILPFVFLYLPKSLKYSLNEKISLISLFKPLYLRNSIAMCLIFFCNMYVFYGVSTWLPTLMLGQGYAMVSSITFLSVFLLGNVITAPIVGFFVDKVGFKKMMSIGYLVMAIVIVLFSFKMISTAQMLFVFIIGGCIGIVQNTVLAIVPKFYPVSQRGTAIGTFSACSRLGSFIAPSVIGLLLLNSWNIYNIFLVFAIPSIVGLVAIMKVK